MSRFTIPRDVYFGEGVVSELKHINVQYAVIVMGG